MPNRIVELLTYRLQPGHDTTGFLAVVAATAPVLHGQPGLLDRSLTCDDAGIWTEVIRWTSQAHADAAGQAIMADPGAAPLMAAIDMASLTLRFQPLLWHKSG